MCKDSLDETIKQLNIMYNFVGRNEFLTDDQINCLKGNLNELKEKCADYELLKDKFELTMDFIEEKRVF